ncbi:hypothetical protein BV20DRAFT_1082019 [Pilatotrama ljubarskyi]|nr:hypothetical protein BV20DRAFT_1082019 [Pilatotrama ljubarskyi]
MANRRDAITEVIRILRHLGGPDCSEDDIRWAQDIPAGKEILEWLAAQVTTAQLNVWSSESVNGRLGRHERSQDELYLTILDPIALYKEESNVLQQISRNGVGIHSRPPVEDVHLSYKLPSLLRTRAEALEHEADALELRTERLRHRLGPTKSVEEDLKQAITAVRKQTQESDQATKETEERLTDLSNRSDGSVAQCARQSLQLLEGAQQRDDKLTALKLELASLDRARLAIAEAVGHLYQTLNEGYRSLPTRGELQRNACAVHFHWKTNPVESAEAANLISASYVEQLDNITRQFAEPTPKGSDEAEKVLRRLDISDTPEEDAFLQIVPDVKRELERAGRWDRFLLLQMQERELDNSTRCLEDQVFPRMQRAYDVLHERSAIAAETEAVISALIEELEDANDTVEITKDSHPSLSAPQRAEAPEDVLEAAITQLLKCRSRADRPTVLLDRSDVEAELQSLAGRAAASRSAEDQWAAGVEDHLAKLNISRMSLLSAAYQNSPVNTSAPFAPPRKEEEIGHDARRKAGELTHAAARLQKDSELSSRDKRKLASFIEKWALT